MHSSQAFPTEEIWETGGTEWVHDSFRSDKHVTCGNILSFPLDMTTTVVRPCLMLNSDNNDTSTILNSYDFITAWWILVKVKINAP